jgi:hypothetical protein
MSLRSTRPSLFCCFIIILALVTLAVDGEMSPAAALDRWTGTAVVQGFVVNFTVLVNPGVGASWEWRFNNVVLGNGPLAAFVSGSRVTGTIFTTGGAVFQPGVCCRPCNFSGTITGNRVDGVFDPRTCGDDGTGGGGSFTLTKQ